MCLKKNWNGMKKWIKKRKWNELRKEKLYIYMGISECIVWWPFKGTKEIKSEEGEKLQKGGSVSDCERGESVVHL